MTAPNRRRRPRRPRRKLPAHRTWPLSATDVNESLGELASRLTELTFLTGPDSGTAVLAVGWRAPVSRNYGRGVHPDCVGLFIEVHPVDTAERAAIRAVLKETVLPQLHAWITEALAATETWRLASHLHRWHLADGQVTRADADEEA